MYYNLVSAGVIPNEKSTYRSLSRFTAKLRKNGELPMDCFADSSRRIEDINDTYRTPEQYIDNAIRYLLNATENYIATIPRWHKRPEYVEVWTEKDVMVGVLKSILRDRQVRIVPNKGFSRLAFVDQNLSRLREMQLETEDGIRNIENIHILYFGDFDPSGDSMDGNIQDLLEWGTTKYKLKDNITFERVSLTPEQIDQYGLPPNPDLGNPNSKAYKKLHKDPRKNSFVEKYGKLTQYEVDALHAFVPEEFKAMVLNAVDKYFDEDIYNEVLEQEEHSLESLNKLLRQKIKKLISTTKKKSD